ncbi:YtxH domain-containing protein [Paracidobacterium acidisoli]|uniref:YtxH domain-containing protein n=1 Tax=Paracidobacterium acidisoli TaxID=2303751 RepID=A0A372ISR2_9BACT|nr:YtxH domain-containing protein [Paracidobacterium acidisoli]MBT9330758.1 YtxH domain-containing protein [Paracidobacterium acidisoli]
MNSVKVWAAFTIGVAAGAAVALLYAPQTGDRTRRQLRRNIEDAGEYIRDTASTLGDQAEKYVKRGREAVADVVDTAQSTVKKAVSTIS